MKLSSLAARPETSCAQVNIDLKILDLLTFWFVLVQIAQPGTVQTHFADVNTDDI